MLHNAGQQQVFLVAEQLVERPLGHGELTGYIIHDIGLKNVRLDRDLGIAMIFRFLLAPMLSVALCRAFGVTGLAHDVLIVETAMPVVTQTVVAAAEYGADEEFAAQGAALSTIACFVVIPVLMLIL